MRRTKLFWMTLVCGLLTACNIATSRSPLFFAPPAKTLSLKNGLWVQEDSECGFDVSLTIRNWPSCAEGAVVDGAKIRDRDPKPDDVSTYLLIDHSPAILQIYERVGREASEDYLYFAADVQRDAAGDVVSLGIWPILCGTQEMGSTYIRPFEGFNKACEPDSAATVLREAARQKPQDSLIRLKWVRARP